jgi:putative FmdB family regulatory protein
MPIYAYRCTSCEHAKDVLQKLSDSPLTVCPACGAATFAKQVTAAGFQLKGSGWYATDFKGGAAKKPDAETSTSETTATDAKKSEPGKSESTTASSEATPAKSSDTAAAPAKPAATPAPKTP